MDMPMTRDEHRAKCLEEMADAMSKWWIEENMAGWKYLAAVAFDALNGIARVNPIKATEEMIDSSFTEVERNDYKGVLPLVKQLRARIYRSMSAKGDLTRPPEPKP